MIGLRFVIKDKAKDKYFYRAVDTEGGKIFGIIKSDYLCSNFLRCVFNINSLLKY